VTIANIKTSKLIWLSARVLFVVCLHASLLWDTSPSTAQINQSWLFPILVMPRAWVHSVKELLEFQFRSLSSRRILLLGFCVWVCPVQQETLCDCERLFFFYCYDHGRIKLPITRITNLPRHPRQDTWNNSDLYVWLGQICCENISAVAFTFGLDHNDCLQ